MNVGYDVAVSLCFACFACLYVLRDPLPLIFLVLQFDGRHRLQPKGGPIFASPAIFRLNLVCRLFCLPVMTC